MKAPVGNLEVKVAPSHYAIVGEDNILRYRALVLRSALRLEVSGLRAGRFSAYAIAKKEYGFKGNKAKVLKQLEEWIEANITLVNVEE